MCGIVGYIGPQEAAPIILNGLRQLEYRGYDSAGLAVMGPDGCIQVRREQGKLASLLATVEADPVQGHAGVGHTRWATHGAPSQRNAHPHSSPDGDIVVVQNGIVENFLELRRTLQAAGYRFQSDTDTEVIVHLVHSHLYNGSQGDLAAAVRAALAELKGPSAIVVLSRRHPDVIIAARLGNAGGVVIGEGDREMFIASDIPAILRHTRRLVFLDSRQMAVVRASGAEYFDLAGEPLRKTAVAIDWNPTAAEKGEFRHFMQKEVFEQGRSLTDTLRSRLDFENARVELPSLNLDEEQARARCAGLRWWPAARATTRRWRASITSSGWRASPWKWTTPASFAIASPSSSQTTWCSRSRRAAKRWTPWPRSKRRAARAPSPPLSSTRLAARRSG